jgi:hypothetical protein
MRSLINRSQLEEIALMDMLIREISLGQGKSTQVELGKRKRSIGAIPALGSGASITCEEMRFAVVCVIIMVMNCQQFIFFRISI